MLGLQHLHWNRNPFPDLKAKMYNYTKKSQGSVLQTTENAHTFSLGLPSHTAQHCQGYFDVKVKCDTDFFFIITVIFQLFCCLHSLICLIKVTYSFQMIHHLSFSILDFILVCWMWVLCTLHCAPSCPKIPLSMYIFLQLVLNSGPHPVAIWSEHNFMIVPMNRCYLFTI